MRIAIVSERARGRGASEASWNLALALKEDGHDVGYYFAEKSEEAEQTFATAVQFGSWQRSNRAIRAMRSLETGSRRWFDEQLLRREELAESRVALLSELEKFGPDIVHVHNAGAIGGHSLVGSIRRHWPTLWTAHDRYPFELFHNQWEIDGETETTWEYSPSGQPSSVALEMFKNHPLPCPLLVPSKWLAGIANEKLHGSIHPVKVVPNLIPAASTSASASLADMLNVDLVALTVISQPSYVLKGFSVVHGALSKASSWLGSAEGSGRSVALVVATGDHLGLTEQNIYCLHDLYRMGIVAKSGYLNRDEMARLYSSCDLLVLPSFIENMPNVVLEAAAAGIPTIGSNVGGVPEVVRDGETGWLLEAGDVDAFAGALVEATDNADKRRELGRNAKRQYEQKYSPDVVLERHLKCYLEALDTQPSEFSLQPTRPSLDVSRHRYGPRRIYPTPIVRRVVKYSRGIVGGILRRAGLRA